MDKIKEKYKLDYLILFNEPFNFIYINKQHIQCNCYGHIYNFTKSGNFTKFGNLDGPTRIWFNNKKIVHKEFDLNGEYISSYKKFAKISNHLICNLCNDFCNQECFA